MARCINCRKESILISAPLEVCLDCIRNSYDDVKDHVENVHARVRERFNLPPRPPQGTNGKKCDLCINRCVVPSGERGYCGIRINKDGKFVGGRVTEGHYHSYYDALPTNCVAEWVCPAGTDCGYPEYSFSKGVEYGYKNLAVFFCSCTFNCLFCQNWHYREESLKKSTKSPAAIGEAVDERTACVCYFGGDPASQILYTIKASNAAIKAHKERILRICWETNGSMNRKYLEKITDIALESGGCIKFDLKAWHEEIYYALCGVSNKWTLSNFETVAKRCAERPEPPLLTASTLLIPGYIDEVEVKNIAQFIAAIDPSIPYSLLGFYPHFYMQDLPRTSRSHAEKCLKTARDAGLKNVKIGNIHLLGSDY